MGTAQNVVFRYCDDDGDLCTLVDASLPDALALTKFTRTLRLTANTLTTQGTLAQDIRMQTIRDPLSAILSKIDVLGRRLTAVERHLPLLQLVTALETFNIGAHCCALERKRQ